jgi:uridine kinase
MTDGIDDGPRAHVLGRITEVTSSRQLSHPVRVGIDGICGAGKSTFARALAAELHAYGRPVVLVDSDGFHHVRARRYRQGRDSARGYYEDAYDFESLAAKVLRPLGPGGSRHYAVKVHDLATDAVVTDSTAVAPADAVVLFDATFIQRDELDGLWDEVVYLHADEAAAIRRGAARDASALGGMTAAREAYEARYMAACRIYLEERRPRERASIVVDNTDPTRPVIERVRSL